MKLLNTLGLLNATSGCLWRLAKDFGNLNCFIPFLFIKKTCHYKNFTLMRNDEHEKKYDLLNNVKNANV